MPANTAGTIDIPLEIFGGLVSDLSSTDLPQGASSDCQDVAFQVGLVKTRPALQNAGFATIGGNPTINYLKTYITQTQILRMLALDSLGNVYKENPMGTLASIGTVTASEYATSISQFTREYMAFGDGKYGLDIPRQFDDTNFDRVSQVGPGAPPVATDQTITGAITASPNGLLRAGIFDTFAISTITQSNLLATLTATATFAWFPYFQAGDTIRITGAGVAGYNGTYTVVSVPSLNTLTFIATSSTLGASAGGNVEWGYVTVALTTNLSSVFFTGASATIAGAGVAGYNTTGVIRSVSTGVTSLALSNTAFIGLANSGNGTLTPIGNVAAGIRKVSVIFKTRQGAMFICQSSSSWTAGGGHQVLVSGIPTGPLNIIQRIIVFTLAGGNSFYYLTGVSQVPGSNFVINDNTTTSVTVDFTDAILAAGTSADYLFKLVELGECSGVIDYGLRNFWWGERNKVQNFVNLTFDGQAFTYAFPLGWAPDPTNSPGGSVTITSVWGCGYAISGSAAVTRGMISQTAYQDSNNVPILQLNVAYSARVRIERVGAPAITQGNFVIEVFSTSLGSLGIFVTNLTGLGTSFVEFTGALMTAQTTIPSDAVLRIYTNNTLTNGALIVVDNIEIYPTNQPFNTSLVRGSRVEDPESFDGVNGIMQFGENEGTRVTAAFKLRDSLYFAKERSLWQTKDDGVNEPAKWAINPVSTIVGTPSNHGVGVGSDWVVIATRLGLYYFDGGEPEKISQEIQKVVTQPDGTTLPGWDSINWQYGHTLWCLVDEKQRRIMVGAPTGAATSPNVVFVLDYRGLDTGKDITAHKSIHISAYTGKIYDIADSRKWTRWNMTINSAAQIERTDGTFHVFMGNGAGTGKIYDLLDVENFAVPANFGDDGVAINSYYDTYFFLRPQEEEQFQMGSHRKLYYYLTSYIEGQGTPSLTAFPPGNAPGIALPQSGIALPPLVSPTFTVAIASISRSLNVVTVVTSAPHNLTATSIAVIRGTGNAAFDNQAFGNLGIINTTAFNFILNGANIGAIAAGNVNPLARDLELPVNILTERCKFRVGTNAVGSWFSLRTLTPSIKTDPFAPVRGVN